MGVTENIHNNSGTGLLLGLRWIDMQNYRDPPPYPGHSKQVYPNQPGYRQSFSGSETSTDVSLSSNENLATSQRQEPQGEETQTSFNYHLDLGNTESSSYSILERLGMPASAIDSNGKYSGSNIFNASPSAFHQDHLLKQSLTSLSSSSNSLGLPVSPSPIYSKGYLSTPHWQLEDSVHLQQNDVLASSGEYTSSSRPDAQYSSSSPSSTITSISREGAGNYPFYSPASSRTGSGSDGVRAGSGLLPPSTSHQYLSPRVPPVSTYHHPHPYVNTHWTTDSGDETSSSHSSYTGYHTSSSLTYSQSGAGNGVSGGTISYSNHDQSHSYPSYLPPPPQYPGAPKDSSSASVKSVDNWTSRSYETVDKLVATGSHPDLRLNSSSPGLQMHDIKFHSSQRRPNNSADDSDQLSSSISAKVSQLVEMLTNENRALREELSLTSVKVAKLQKFEMEIQKVHESHEALVKSSQKQESLWIAMKRKLEAKIQNLEARKSEGGSSQTSGAALGSDNRIKLADKDAMISKLLSQNQELSLARNQLEVENVQLSMSISEQKGRVDILENALLNAQSKVMALEEEYRKKQTYVEKYEQLQNALKCLQLASDKQEKKEKELRAHLEKELEMYKAQEKGEGSKKPDLGKEEVKSSGMLRKVLNEKDARILQLEAHLAGMEQKYIKEITLRGLEIEQSSQTPKEVRLAALEKNSSDIEKMIDEAKTEKLKHMEELHQSQKTVAELEAKVKQLQTQLVEKEAMVKVFQRSPLAMARSSSLHCLCHSPLHSPHTSLISPHGWPGSSQVSESASSGMYREFATIRHVKSGSSSAVELENKKSMEEELLSKVQSLNTESRSESEDEGKLFHV